MSHKLLTTLDGIIEPATRINVRIRSHQRDRQSLLLRPDRGDPPGRNDEERWSRWSGQSHDVENEPMQVGCLSLSPREKQRLWLWMHNPDVDWVTGHIKKCRSVCQGTWLQLPGGRWSEAERRDTELLGAVRTNLAHNVGKRTASVTLRLMQ